jgi:tRNA nucleotidyltransferase/poly(A) polymerase
VEAIAAGPGVLGRVEADLRRIIYAAPGPACRMGDLFPVFRQAGIPVWIVGGAPRDWLEGRTCGDVDLACGTTFGAMKRRLLGAFPGGTVFEEYPGFGLLRWGSGREEVDFNILRGLAFPQPGLSMFEHKHRPTDFLSQDAQLRDFTMNALYFCPETGLFLDPTRRGLEAITKGVLEFAGPSFLANTNPFLSLRAIKFMARGFRPGPEVERFVRTHLDEALARIGVRTLSIWLRRQVPANRVPAFASAARGFAWTAEAIQVLQDAAALSAPLPLPESGWSRPSR